jgi:hypothetical protein
MARLRALDETEMMCKLRKGTMHPAIVQKEPDYVLNQCAKYLARTTPMSATASLGWMPANRVRAGKYPPAEPGAYMTLPESKRFSASRRFSAPFSYPNWSGVSNTRHVSAFMA